MSMPAIAFISSVFLCALCGSDFQFLRFWQYLPISVISVNQWFLARRLEELGVVAFARAENSAIILRRLCGEYLAVCSENFSVRICAAD
jgi:hypothetical protein